MEHSPKTVYENNQSILKKNHPAAWACISMDKKESSTGAELVFTKTNKPNILVKNSENERISIHDAENPGSESESFLSMVEKDSTGIVLIFGMGLGYLALNLLKQRKKLQKVIIFELNIEFFRLAMEHMDLAEILDDRRVILSIGKPENIEDILKPVGRTLMLEDIHTHKFVSCFHINEDYTDLASDVFNIVSSYNIQGATHSIHGKTFIENRLRHLTSMHHNNKLEDLAGKFKGLPALIIAAGPSLDKNIEEIHRAVGKAVIISVDTALPALFNHGIKPDFVTSIDYSDPTYEKIADIAANPLARQINLICTSWVACTVTKIFPARTIFWAFGGNALEQWINSSLGGTMAIDGAGTVAHLNFISAKTLGCDPVIFVGQDLAYSYSKEHASDVVFTGTENIEKILIDAVWIKGINEPQVPTTRTMHGYRILFEQWIRNSEGRIINATEGGAWIEGAEHMPLSRAIDLYCSNRVHLEIEFGRTMIDPYPAMVSILKKAIEAEEIINKADKLADSILKEVNKLDRKKNCLTCLRMLPPKLQKQIIILDSTYNKTDKNSFWEFFNETTMEGLRQDEREKKEIEQLEGIPGKYMDWLSRSIRRTDRVNKIRQDNLENFKKQINALISFYAHEKKILDQIDNCRADLSAILSLAERYYENGDYTLLDNFLCQYNREESAIIYYYQGVISLYRREYEKAEHCFDQTLFLDKSFESKINIKRFEMANYYYNWALTLPVDSLGGLENKNGIHMRLKGLKCFPQHESLRDEFRILAEKDLKKISNNIQESGTSSLSASEETLEIWVETIATKNEIQQCIPPDIAAKFFRYYGKLLLDQNELNKALENYLQAIKIIPEKPDLHIALTDVYFSLNDFDAGLQHLKTAVSLDNNFAIYWNNMGDNLQAQGDCNGAIIAYENYFIARPDEIEALKKIGDCHLKLGNIEAANEAHKQFKNLLKKPLISSSMD